METSTAVTLVLIYLSCLGVVATDILTDRDNDMTPSEKVFWHTLAPLGVTLMIWHDIKEFNRTDARSNT